MINKLWWTLIIVLFICGPSYANNLTEVNKDEVFSAVVPVGEELLRDGIPQRYWGVNVNLQPWNNADSIDSMARRIKQVGFNAVRLWPNWQSFYGIDVKNSHKPPSQGFDFKSYSKGDGSQLDLFDRMVFACRENGLSLYMTALMYYPPVYQDSEFVDIVRTDSMDKQAWIEAISGKRWDKGIYSPWWALHYLDERFQEIWLRHSSLFLNHVNQYTGLRNADDNNIVMWQLHNESRFIDKFMLNNEYRVPAKKGKVFPYYFQKKLQNKYNDFLIKKYATSEKLIESWSGLLPGESLESGNIDAGAKSVTNEAYDTQRVKDFTVFINSLVNNWNKKFIDHIRSHATGAGVAVTAIATDTFSWASLPHYSSMYEGSLIAFGNYPNPQGKRLRNTNVSKPWTLKLGATGAWAPYDFTRPYGKPAVIYETNFNKFAMYDAELPWLLALFSSWQNINGVFYYFWNAPKNHEQSIPYGQIKFAYRGKEIWGDEVFIASIHAASEAYLKRLLPIASNPTIFSFNEAVVSNPAWKLWSYTRKSHSGLSVEGIDKNQLADLRKYIAGSAFNNGARVRVVEGQKSQLIVSGAKATKMRLNKNVIFNDNVQWKADENVLFIDLPKIKVYLGITNNENINWSDGFSIKGLNLNELAEGELHDPFVSISLVSLDGKDLINSDDIHVFALSHSYNHDIKNKKNGKLNIGKGRVITRRIEGLVTIPFQGNKKVTHRNFLFKPVSSSQTKTGFSLFSHIPVYDTKITK